MTMNAEFPMLPSHVSTPHRRTGGLATYTRPSQLLSTPPRSHRTPARSISRKKISVPRMSPSPRVGRTPVSTSTKRKASTVGDRFIPSRRSMNVDMCRRSLFSEEPIDEEVANDTPCSQQMKKFKKTLLSSLCDYPIESLDDNAKPKSLFRSTNRESSRTSGPTTRVRLEDPYLHNMLGGDFTRSGRANGSSSVQPHTSSGKIVSTEPSKVLSAEYIKDDYYMDHLSWNEENVLAIAIDNMVYLYNCTSCEAVELASYNETIHWFRGSDHNYPSSVAWCNSSANSKYLAVGISSSVDIWDTQSGQKLRNLRGHDGRVLSLSWNQHCLTTGGTDSRILHHDVRCANSLVARCVAHEEEVVGLKWNREGDMLASGGGSDMMLCIWDLRMASSGRNRAVEPRLKLREHESSVQAIDWNPHHRGVLASGGGTDGTIKIWNSQTGAVLSSTETWSYVSSVNWSQHRNELCSSHGGSNALTLWKYDKGSNLTKMTDFVGHDSRILSTACSPDGCQVASASADETIHFWDVFGEPVRKPSSSKASSIWGEVWLGDHVVR